MIRSFLVRPRAERDIQAAFDWYESQRAGLGDEFLAALRERLKEIRDFPEANPKIHRDVRRAVLSRFPYLIFYVVKPAVVAVLGVLHHARDPAKWPRK